MMKLKLINPEETYPIRLSELRRGMENKECRFDGDFEPTSFHVGCFDGDALVAVATFHQKDKEGLPTPAYQLRGMAVSESCQKSGIGRKVLEKGLELARERGAKTVWCNARVHATGFYDRCGFTRIGEQFHIPDVGPHYAMYIKL